MIVVDASAMVEALVGPRPHPALLHALAHEPIAAPHLLDLEVLSVLRGLERGRRIDPVDAEQKRLIYGALTISRYETLAIADRIWELRHQFTAYDASYLALAEALGCTLMTCDAMLDTPGHDAQVSLVLPAP